MIWRSFGGRKGTKKKTKTKKQKTKKNRSLPQKKNEQSYRPNSEYSKFGKWA